MVHQLMDQYPMTDNESKELEELRIKFIEDAIASATTLNEIRKKMGLGPLPGPHYPATCTCPLCCPGKWASNQALMEERQRESGTNVDRLVKVGERVIYHNPVGKPFEALVTAVWGPKCINVIFISGDTERTDSFGRQLERQTSLSHVSNSPVHGQYWRFEDETPNPIVEPLEK